MSYASPPTLERRDLCEVYHQVEEAVIKESHIHTHTSQNKSKIIAMISAIKERDVDIWLIRESGNVFLRKC